MSDEYVSIKGLSKAKVLAVLFNGSRTQGLGFYQISDNAMDEKTAEKILLRQTSFDYLQGRVMKIDLSGDEFDPWGYDRDNGQGAAQRLIDELRRTGDTNPEEAEINRLEGTRDAAMVLMEHLRDKPLFIENEGEIPVFLMTAAPHADNLEPILKKVLGDEPTETETNDVIILTDGQVLLIVLGIISVVILVALIASGGNIP